MLAEIDYLVSKYGIRRIEFADNIMPMGYFKSLFPALARRPDRLHIMYETTARLRDEHVSCLAEAGVTWIQPGIENLDDHLLRLLNKNTTVWNNIQLLKSCQKYGIYVMWNYLANIPGDTAEAYEKTIAWLPLVFHLQPPEAVSLLRYDRFSPCHAEAQHLGLALASAWPYKYVYPLPAAALHDLAYYFEDQSIKDMETVERKARAFSTINSIVEHWKDCYFRIRDDIVKAEISPSRPRLKQFTAGDELIIEDTRPCAVASRHVLGGRIAEIYRVCDGAPTMDLLVKHFQETRKAKSSRDDIVRGIEFLVDRKLLLKLKDRLISLAIECAAERSPVHDNYPGGLVKIPRQKPPVIA